MKQKDPFKDVEMQYQEVTLDNVISYYAIGFTPEDKRLISYEAFVDTAKGVVVFRLYTMPK